MNGPNNIDHEYYPNIGFNTSADFHVYRVEWYPDHMTWIVDGKPVRTVNKADTYDGKLAEYIYPMEVWLLFNYLLLFELSYFVKCWMTDLHQLCRYLAWR
jgi:Glycosyl hydrolases family 16